MRILNVHALFCMWQYFKEETTAVSMSAKPSRRKAYRADLRLGIVYQRIAMNLPFYEITHNLNIAACTSNRIYQVFVETGGVDPVQRLKRREIGALDVHTELHVIGDFIENPSVYLGEVCCNICDINVEVCYNIHDITVTTYLILLGKSVTTYVILLGKSVTTYVILLGK